jgi:hypothetical protein
VKAAGRLQVDRSPVSPSIFSFDGCRDINRRHFTRAEVEQAPQRPVVRSLLALIRLRNRHPAFGGLFTLLPSGPRTLALRWDHRGGLLRTTDVGAEQQQMTL